ncbi:MAG TPA: ATP-binding protein [Candidatus Polarisedimenticolaceae bacterium]|nr:ATP-binding protein [Candidatus Polarisedimenticolaceae bacterium]
MFERHLLLRTLLVGLPGGLVALALLWTGEFSSKVQWTLTVFVVGAWLGLAFAVRDRVIVPLRTLSNLLAALREGDYSIRARGARTGDSLGEVLHEMNALTELLRERRLDALDATTLLRTIMEEIDVAVFAFDAERRLRLVNRAGERLLARSSERLLGASASELGLEDCLVDSAPWIVERAFPGGAGRWEVRRSAFRQAGLPLQMLVITDLSRALRQEERQAWQRLIRVLGHELNNSLAPIRSIAGSLETLLGRSPRPADWESDLERGLAVIAARSDALNRFMEGYARLARLPAPHIAPFELSGLVRRVAGLETRLPVAVAPGPALTVRADADQLEQLLINLVRNAADAALETHGGVRVGWNRNGSQVELWVEDEGPGLSSTANLFVPFFTTKPGGSGIGLVLCRQIAEAHGGTLVIANRAGITGCEARLRLPL